MLDSGYIVYVLLAFILARFWWKVRGYTLNELFINSAAEHHQVMRVHDRHPNGGSWRAFQNWIREDIKIQSYHSLYNQK